MTTPTSPDVFFGHPLGADRHLARWDQIVNYFDHLASKSDRILVENMGTSTQGHPFLLAFISAPENLRRLEAIRKINLAINHPEHLSSTQLDDLLPDARAIVCQSMSLHANEVGGTQMAPQLAFDLLTTDTEAGTRILDEVVFLMVPCFNPDGQMMMVDWYEQGLDSEYEGGPLPWLYHHYAGHDNNRDAFMLNLVESQHMARILYRNWKPQVYQDHHHMGSYGARFYVAPYCDPIRPHADPIIWREHAWLGAHMALALEAAGTPGVLNGAQYPGWGHLGFHWITAFHNIAGMLTESANAKIATPLYIHPHQLKGSSEKTMPEYRSQVNFPNPWDGGWWRLGDIVRQKKIASWALLDLCARYKDPLLINAHQKAQRQIRKGRDEGHTFIISRAQHDPLTVDKLIRRLLDQGLTIEQSITGFCVSDRHYQAGSFLIRTAQPKRGLIKTLLAQTRYPEHYWTRTPEGAPTVFDTASDTLAEYMGVEVDQVASPVEVETQTVKAVPKATGRPLKTDGALLLDPRLNDAFTVVNQLLDAGVPIQRLKTSIETPNGCLPPGAFRIERGTLDPSDLSQQVEKSGVSFLSVPEEKTPHHPTHPVRRRSLGIYQRYWGGNADEGWTRLVLEQFGFPYTTVQDDDIRDPDLTSRFDTLLLPHDPTHLLIDITEDEDAAQNQDHYPPEYRSGLKEAGVKALRAFVHAGGRLIALDAAWETAARAGQLKVKNVVSEADSTEYFTHGSTLRSRVDIHHPLGYGMTKEALILNWDSAVFEITDTHQPEAYDVICHYPQSNLLASGRLLGEELIRGKATLLRIQSGKGDIILFGFRPQHRGQMHGTFKLLFNCLL